MKWNIPIFALLLLGVFAVPALGDVGVPGTAGGGHGIRTPAWGGGTVATDIHLPDDKAVSWGNTSVLPDFSCEYVSASTAYICTNQTGEVYRVTDGGTQLLVNSGTAAAPGLAIGYANNGLSSTSATRISATVGGVERFRFGTVAHNNYRPIDMNGNEIYDLYYIYAIAPATDIATNPLTISTQPPNSTPGATNTSGAHLVLAPSSGLAELDGVTQAGSAGQTLAFTVCIQGVCATTTKTEGVASPDGWVCAAAASDAECVDNLDTLLTGAGAITGMTMVHTGGTEIASFNVVPGTSEYLTVVSSSDPGAFDVTLGDNGKVVASEWIVLGPEATSSVPALKRVGVNVRFRLADDSDYTNITAKDITSTDDILAAAAGDIGWSTRTDMTSPSAGQWRVAKSTDVGAIIMDVAPTVKGQTVSLTSVVANCTFSGGAGSTTCATSAFIPLGFSVTQVTGRQVTPSTTCTTCKAGADMGAGLDDDQYGTALECDVNDTLYTTATATANVMGTCLLAGGCTITMTTEAGGDCVDGVAAWTISGFAATAASSD